MVESYYRYDDEVVDEYGSIQLRLSEYPILKRTPKGVWLSRYLNGWISGDRKTSRRFVLNEGRKRFAWPTKHEALISFEARRKRQIRIYHARIASAEQALDLAHEERSKLTGVPLSNPFTSPAPTPESHHG